MKQLCSALHGSATMEDVTNKLGLIKLSPLREVPTSEITNTETDDKI